MGIEDQRQHKKEGISTSPAAKKENPSTYFVEDRYNEQELTRLTVQDRLLNATMGGVLAEQPDPTVFHRVLDIGCGPGGWVIEAARTFPAMTLVGIDISQRMLDVARNRAATDRVEFRVMDALQKLDFPDSSFDLVNLRFAFSYLRTWDWPRVIGEMLRVCHAGGVIRLTEPEVAHQSNSPGTTKLSEMMLCAFFRSGHLFTQETDGLTSHLPRLLTRYGCKEIGTRTYTIESRRDTPEGQAYFEDGKYILQTIRPFLQKWGCVTIDYDVFSREALAAMERPDFYSSWPILSAWGSKP